MSIDLPQPRSPNRAVPRLLDWGSNQKPPLGGSIQRLNRLGSRYAYEITYPRLKPEPDGRILAARVRRALTEGALFAIPQPGLVIGTPGSPVVNGAGQAGRTINLRGFAAGYTVREGQFFSIIIGGRRYLYCASTDATATGAGTMSLPIHPMLRIAPGDSAVCEFAQPYIEGVLSGNAAEVELTIAKAIIPTLTITERS